MMDVSVIKAKQNSKSREDFRHNDVRWCTFTATVNSEELPTNKYSSSMTRAMSTNKNANNSLFL